MINDENVEMLKVAAAKCSNPHQCALMRLAADMDMSTSRYSLSEIAEVRGFSKAEAHGIMDGWDSIRYGEERLVFRFEYHQVEEMVEPGMPHLSGEYDKGFLVGRALAEQFLPHDERNRLHGVFI